jgi:nucleoside-diphosphate-sugar epimerase
MAASPPKRVLLTGATGFIGFPAIDALTAHGYEVHAAARAPVEHSGVHRSHPVDLLDPSAVSALVAAVQPTHLLHLAWDVSYEGAQNLDWVQSSLHLLKEVQRHGGRRVVLAGSCFEYDFDYGYCTEGLTPSRPNTFYGQAKNGLSRLAHAYGDAAGLSVATARIFFVYGPRQPSRQLIPHVIESLRAGRTARCTHGRQIRDYLHVSDVASACVALLGSAVEGVVNVGSGEPTRLRDMIYAVADTLDARSLVALGDREPRPGEPPLLVANPARLRDEVGWAPSYTLAEGLADTVAWWQSSAPVPSA